MNLIVVDKCTNHCAYCFAATEMAKSTSRAVLSRTAIDELLEFIRRSGPDFDLNVIGGEPFIYIDLPYLLDRLYEEPTFGSATVFTGGIFNRKALDRIAHHADRTVLLVNLNERRDYHHTSEYSVVRDNMAAAIRLGFRIVIGFNIWRADFDYAEILNACAEFGVEHLRWTVAYPEANPSPGITVLSPAEYPHVARRCAEFLEEAYQRGIQAYLDCPLPKCFFTAAEVGRILLTQPMSATAIRSCGPVIDVAPDLSVFRCFALSGHARTKLSQFENHRELVEWYEKAIDEKYDRPTVYAACATCEFAENRTCFGGCLGHNTASIGKRLAPDELLARAHAALLAGDPDGAEFLLDQIPGQQALPALMRAYLELDRGASEAARRWARIAVNRSQSSATRAKARALLARLSDPQQLPVFVPS